MAHPTTPKILEGRLVRLPGARTAGLRLSQKGLRAYAGAIGGQAGQSEEMTVLHPKIQVLSGHAEEKSLSGFGLGGRFKGLLRRQMKTFPGERRGPLLGLIAASLVLPHIRSLAGYPELNQAQPAASVCSGR